MDLRKILLVIVHHFYEIFFISIMNTFIFVVFMFYSRHLRHLVTIDKVAFYPAFPVSKWLILLVSSSLINAALLISIDDLHY